MSSTMGLAMPSFWIVVVAGGGPDCGADGALVAVPLLIVRSAEAELAQLLRRMCSSLDSRCASGPARGADWSLSRSIFRRT
jgi:hypothetical protein